ncbi:MAG: serine protease, partial [Bacteroidetes bacterium]|nr:serine protease [Bacteroidota bacterium]
LLCLPMIGFGQSWESKAKNYLDTNQLDIVEGLWTSYVNGNPYQKLFCYKTDLGYEAITVEKYGLFGPTVGKVYATIEDFGDLNVFTIKSREGSGICKLKTNNIAECLDGGFVITLLKNYPKNTTKRKLKKGEWESNGSGIIISKSGHIITNYHVIKDAEDIEVEFILNDEVQKFSAEIIKSDKVNDLSVIKIVDVNFDGVKELPYNFQTISVDVGTDVFALGYPKALTIMGKEIKFTDGRISSKTGFKGDITTYQSTTPIQPGNSGGPLFDFKGNLIGINTAKIVTEDVEGVSYSIKSSYLLELVDVLPEKISLPSSTQLASKQLTEQIKILSDYVVLIKVK